MEGRFFKVLTTDCKPVSGSTFCYAKGVWSESYKSGHPLYSLGELVNWIQPGTFLWIAEGRDQLYSRAGVTYFSSVRLLEPLGELDHGVLVRWALDCVAHVADQEEDGSDAKTVLDFARSKDLRLRFNKLQCFAKLKSVLDAQQVKFYLEEKISVVNYHLMLALFAALSPLIEPKSVSFHTSSAAWSRLGSDSDLEAEKLWQGQRLLDILESEGGVK